MLLLWVMIGGFMGSVCRYALGEWMYTGDGFPSGTLTINLIGCFILGWFLIIIGRNSKRNAALTVCVGTGFLGSFTTFATFSVETVTLVQSGQLTEAVLYVLTTTLGGLLLTFLGARLALLRKQGGNAA